MFGHSRRAARRRCSFFAALSVTILVSPFAAQAQDTGGFHEVETKYIFGSFTLGSSTGIEGEKAFEPDTKAGFGKGGGHYGVGPVHAN